jgi:hypothetical protein
MQIHEENPTTKTEGCLHCSVGPCQLDLTVEQLLEALDLPQEDDYDAFLTQESLILVDVIALGYMGSLHELKLNWYIIPPS